MKKIIIFPKKTIKLISVLVLCVATPSFSAETTLLFTPGPDLPFFINSITGELIIDEPDESGQQAMTLRTEGDGNNVQLVAHNLPFFSLRQQQLVLWVKAHNIGDMKDFWLYASDSADFSNRIVYMISNDKTQLIEDKWTRISMPLSAGSIWESPNLDKLNSFQFWLNDNGRAPVSVQLGPMYLEKIAVESSIVITFDDGWKSQAEHAAPIMEEMGLKGTAYIIPELIGRDNYMSVDDLNKLTEYYGWSLGCHHSERMDGMSLPEIRTLLEDKNRWFDDNNLRAEDFSYPNGAFDSELLQTVSEYYRSGRTIVEFPETLPPGDAFRLRVLNLVPPVNLTDLQSRLELLGSSGELLILVFHKITETPKAETEISISDFKNICSIISRSKIAVKTMDDISASFAGSEEDMPKPRVTPALFQTTTKTQPDFPRLSDNGIGPLSESANKDPLIVPAPGTPESELKTQLDFSLDWRMVWGVVNSEAEYYTQLDDLHLYLQNELYEDSRLYAAAGIKDVNFTDFSEGTIDGSMFYLDSLYMEQKLPLELTLKAGYFSPDPVHKWLQVTRSAAVEPALGQDITPSSLWITASWKGNDNLGIQTAFVPDFFGVTTSEKSIRVIKYQESLGLPNLFGSIWWDSETIDAEITAALNGDALKIAASGGYFHDFQPIRLSASIGAKYTRGTEFTTLPEWDHLNDVYRLSSGLAASFPVNELIITPGIAYKITINGSTPPRHMGGVDIGLSYGVFELYSVFTFFDLTDAVWGDNTGMETGLIIDYNGIEYMAGYTMSGFSTFSGLYNNNTVNNGGIDGFFLRIKATYW